LQRVAPRRNCVPFIEKLGGSPVFAQKAMLAARPNSIRKNFTAVVLATTFADLLVAATALLFEA
jgi:hypothetical protein